MKLAGIAVFLFVCSGAWATTGAPTGGPAVDRSSAPGPEPGAENGEKGAGDGCPRSNDEVCDLREETVDSLILVANSAAQIAQVAPFCNFQKFNPVALYCQYFQSMTKQIEISMKEIKDSGFVENCVEAQAELRRIIAGMQYTRPLIARIAVGGLERDLWGYRFATTFDDSFHDLIGPGCIQDFTRCTDVCLGILGADCVNGDTDCFENCEKLLVQQCNPSIFDHFENFCEELEASISNELGSSFADVPVEVMDELLRGCNEVRSEYKTFCDGAFEDDRCARIVVIDENLNSQCLDECDLIQQDFQCEIDEQCCADNRKCGECCSDEECVEWYGEGAICPIETNDCEGGKKCLNETQCEVGETCCTDIQLCGECCSDDDCNTPSTPGASGDGDGVCSVDTNQCEGGGGGGCSACEAPRTVCCRGGRLYLWLLCKFVQGTEDTFCCTPTSAQTACV